MGTKFSTLIRCLNPKRFLLLTVGALSLAVAVWATTAVVSLFELDGNSVVNGSLDDWNKLNGTTGQNGICTGPCKLKVFAFDGDGQTIFTTGGSKDDLDIPNWQYKNGSVPPKDEIQNAYAASYNAPNGDVIVYFGADREAVSGDSNIGIWFFQNAVGPNGTGGFTGAHADHDVFVVSAFTVGGTTPGIQVYEWDHNCGGADNNNPQPGDCADNGLRVLFSAAQSCSASGVGHEACAKVNAAPINVSWPYTPSHGALGDPVPAAGFFEGGVNITELFSNLGQTRPCFASFLVETRSSQSTTATLKDFVAHAFPQCHVSISKSCACTSFHSDAVSYDYTFNGTVTNDGGGTLWNVSVKDQGKTYACNLPNGLDVNASVNFPSATCTGPTNTFTAGTFPSSNTATVSANTANDVNAPTVTGDTGPVSCDTESPAGACTPNPILTVDKKCVTTLEVKSGFVVVRVDYTGQVHNGGNVNITSVAVTENDNADGTIDTTYNVGTLTPLNTVGADKCYTNGGLPTCPNLQPPLAGSSPIAGVASYNPNAIATNPVLGRASFKDTVRATGTSIYGKPVESHPAGTGLTAECFICPFGFCTLQ